ncbi:MAG: hypothetical protein M0T79_13950 [Actinomycetota bacterium]|nr:hypothetical protein [Actinomycetota bacterium]
MGTTTSRRSSEAVEGASTLHDPPPAPFSDEQAEAAEVLIKEARRRQRRRWALSALAIVAAVGLVAGLATSFSPPPPKHGPPPGPKGHPPAPRPVRPTVTKTADGLVSWHGPMHSPRAFVTSLGLYFAWNTTRLGAGSVHGVLARVDPLTGEMSVVDPTQGTATSAVAVHGSLFAVLTSETPKVPRGRLVRLNPTTLKVIRSWALPAELTSHSMVAAGGGVWVAAGDHLERVTPASGSVTASLTLRRAAAVSLGTNTTGSMLVAAANIATGAHYLERIDPSTGAVELRTPRTGGTASIGGIVHTALWIAVGSGTMGNALLYSAVSLQRLGPGCHTGVGTETCVLGSSPRPEFEGGRLYITTPNAPTRNYCALPSGQAIAPLPIDLRDDYVLAIGRTGRTFLLFQVTRTTLRTPTISEVRIPAPCR